MKDYKETHDLVISPMAPSYCRGCGLSGFELRLKSCTELSQRLSKTDSQAEGSQNASGDPKRKANT